MRCSVDAVMHFKDTQQLVSIKALNEFDPKCAHFLLLCRVLSIHVVVSSWPLSRLSTTPSTRCRARAFACAAASHCLLVRVLRWTPKKTHLALDHIHLTKFSETRRLTGVDWRHKTEDQP